MKTTVNQYAFTEAFRVAGRSESFSYSGLKALFEHLEGIEESTGEEIELDVVGLCCEYSEYETALEAAADMGWDSFDNSEDEQEELALKWLQDQTSVITHPGGIIVQSF